MHALASATRAERTITPREDRGDELRRADEPGGHCEGGIFETVREVILVAAVSKLASACGPSVVASAPRSAELQRAVELLVGGQRYRVVSSASPEDLERLARVVDDKIAELVPPGRPITPQALLLAAMALAHDLDEEKVRYASLQRDTGTSLARILGRVDEALASIEAPAPAPAMAGRGADGPRSLEAHHGAHDPLDR